jgi:heptosyltransferase-2
MRLTVLQNEKAPRTVAFDCRYFLGDRPCVWHKREGLLCTCPHYAPVRENLLIIKLDAMGDVLRTTALLPVLAAEHPEAAITWITRPEAVPLLENNPYLTEVIPYGPDAMIHLQARSFDRIINLDAGKVSAGLAATARGRRKDGFLLNEAGRVMATNEAALRWLEMGVFDDLKRCNEQTYQSLMADILGLPRSGHHYVLELTETERARARTHLKKLGMSLEAPIVGLNTGAGGRWELKQWRLEGFQELVERLHKECGIQLLLLGGPGERERNELLKQNARVPVFDAGCDNTVRHFAALTELCSVVVTGDTLAMHIALALRRRVVVLFGPTSAPEIDLYGLGEKVFPDMECLGCYKQTCNFVPNCMDLISVEMVAGAVKKQLNRGSSLS